MRNYEEYSLILHLWDEGVNKLQIEKQTGIPRTTVRDCIKKFGSLENLLNSEDLSHIVSWRTRLTEPDYRKNYAYLFGLYLGDGYVSPLRKTYRLRIVQDQKYPGLIELSRAAIQTAVPHNKVHILYKTTVRAAVISAYSNDWPEIFPQHGIGEKHSRSIQLEEWQQSIVDEYPLEFFKGLYHSDGSRTNVSHRRRRYAIYQFAQKSVDIRKLFTDTAEKLGLSWTQYGRNTTIGRRMDVAFLDSCVGPKY